MRTECLRSRRGLRIGVDMISAGSDFAPGVGGMISYYDGLLGALCALPGVGSVVAMVPPWNGSLAVPDHPKIEMVPCLGLPRNRLGRVLYEQMVLPAIAASQKVDVLLCTVNIMPFIRRAPTVVVLQSLQYFIMPQQFGRLRRAYLYASIPRSMRQADRVITVSDTAKRDLLRFVPAEPDRFVTVHHGVSGWTKTALEAPVLPRPYILPDRRPYVLMVSRLYEHKNHRRLIEAFAHLITRDSLPHHLVLAGGDADVSRADLEALAGDLGVSDRVHCLGMVRQGDIPGLFAGAAAAAYVSLYETFGHPVLEAFAFGLPLVTSDSGATAEIAGDAARLVDPKSVTSIAEGLHDVLTDESLRRRLAEAGRARVREFTWERCAEETLSVLEQACERAEPSAHASDQTGSW